MFKRVLIIILCIAIIAFFLSAYTVQQTQKAIVLQLGQIEQTAKGQPLIVQPGLHFKIPFVQTVKPFDMRLRTFDIDSSRIMTQEQKEVLVDAFVKWRISDIVTYYKSTGGNAALAEQLLAQKVNDGLRNEFGQQTISQLLSEERVSAMGDILKNAQKAAESLGIVVTDVRIKRLDLPTEVEQKIFARMRSAREKIAAQLRADGQQQAEIIKSQADAQVTIILSKANSDAAKIRAQGDAEAAKIYNQAYDQNPTFYDFLKSLQSYQEVFGNNHNTVVLRPQGEFFKNFVKPVLAAPKVSG